MGNLAPTSAGLLLWMVTKPRNNSTGLEPFVWISQANDCIPLLGMAQGPPGAQCTTLCVLECCRYLLPRRCGGTLVLQSHRARSISSHLLCRAEKAPSDKSSIWKGRGQALV